MHPPAAVPPQRGVQEESFTTPQGGWRVTAVKGPIIGSPLLEEYQAALGGVLSLPEILFGHSRLTLTHQPSGLTLTFNARDALAAWAADDLPPLKVAGASDWQAARQAEIDQQQAQVLTYDWTFTTAYAGTLLAAAGCGDQTAGANQAQPPAAADGQQQQQQQQQQPQQLPQQPPQWQASVRQIDRAMLMSKAEPILFYAEVPLYESELDDNGVCQLTVKVRVMPRCWLVLLRFWLRVDGSLVRLREVRHFCRLDAPQPVIIRETKHSEGSMAELAAAGAPTSVAGYEDADAATAVFSAIAPQCLRKFELHELPLPAAQ